MKRKIVIISATVVVLALIVTVGIFAQSGHTSKNKTTEQTSKNVPDKCKGCPSQSTCSEVKDQTANSCQPISGDKKSCTDASKCNEAKDEAKGCPEASDCNKACEKKSN